MVVNTELILLKATAYAYAVPFSGDLLTPYPFHQGNFALDDESKPMVITRDNYKSFLLKNTSKVTKMARESDDPVHYILCMMSKPYRLQFLDLVKEDLDAQRIGELLSWIWVSTEFPNMNNLDRWVKLFKMVLPESLMDEEELKNYKALPAKVTIYRGIQSDKAKTRGLSWTLSIDKAKWFACRWQRVGEVYSATIRKDGIFAYFNGRGEEEIVVNPRKLKEVQPVYIKEETK